MQSNEIKKAQQFVKLHRYRGLINDLQKNGYSRPLAIKALSSSELTEYAVKCLAEAKQLCQQKINELNQIVNQA